LLAPTFDDVTGVTKCDWFCRDNRESGISDQSIEQTLQQPQQPQQTLQQPQQRQQTLQQPQQQSQQSNVVLKSAISFIWNQKNTFLSGGTYPKFLKNISFLKIKLLCYVQNCLGILSIESSKVIL